MCATSSAATVQPNKTGIVVKFIRMYVDMDVDDDWIWMYVWQTACVDRLMDGWMVELKNWCLPDTTMLYSYRQRITHFLIYILEPVRIGQSMY